MNTNKKNFYNITQDCLFNNAWCGIWGEKNQLNLSCTSGSDLASLSLFSEGCMEKNKNLMPTIDGTLTPFVCLPWCSVLFVLLIDWLVFMDCPVVDTSQYCQVSVFLGAKGEKLTTETKKEWVKGKILIRWRAHWIPYLPDLPKCLHHRCSTLRMFIPRSLSSCPPHFNCPFVSALCGFVCKCVHVCICVYACLSCR